jgi:hypothetical protein
VVPRELVLALQPTQQDVGTKQRGRKVDDDRGGAFDLDALPGKPGQQLMQSCFERFHFSDAAEWRLLAAADRGAQFGQFRACLDDVGCHLPHLRHQGGRLGIAELPLHGAPPDRCGARAPTAY